MPQGPPSKASIFSRGTDLCSLEMSCNSGGSGGHYIPPRGPRPPQPPQSPGVVPPPSLATACPQPRPLSPSRPGGVQARCSVTFLARRKGRRGPPRAGSLASFLPGSSPAPAPPPPLPACSPGPEDAAADLCRPGKGAGAVVAEALVSFPGLRSRRGSALLQERRRGRKNNRLGTAIAPGPGARGPGSRHSSHGAAGGQRVPLRRGIRGSPPTGRGPLQRAESSWWEAREPAKKRRRLQKPPGGEPAARSSPPTDGGGHFTRPDKGCGEGTSEPAKQPISASTEPAASPRDAASGPGRAQQGPLDLPPEFFSLVRQTIRKEIENLFRQGRKTLRTSSALGSWPAQMAVTLHTDVGDIKIELFCERTPKACENFLALCASNYYTGCIFHRNIKGFMVQTGDPAGSGKGGSSIWGRKFEDEFSEYLKHSVRGVVSMANNGPNTNGSQFFITYGKQPHLDMKYTVFGKVIDGLDTLDELEKLPVNEKTFRPLSDVHIKDITIHANPFAP